MNEVNLDFPLCFEISHERSIQDSSRQTILSKEILQSQQQVVRSLTRLGLNLTFSLRYFYDPTQLPKIKTYLLLNLARENQTEEIYDQILSLLTKGKISEFFKLNYKAESSQFYKLDWVRFIGEVLKHEDFIEQPNCYLAYHFDANPANDMLAVYDVINRLDGKLILEITLQTYQTSYEESLWVNAITQIITQLDKINVSKSGNKDNLLSHVLVLYQKYQNLYPSSDLFRYGIKALAENRGDAAVVVHTLIEHATKENPYGKQPKIVIVSQGKPEFSDSLQATKNIDISTAIEWEGWQKGFEQMLIRESIQPKKTGLAKFSDGSLSLSNLSSASRLANPVQHNSLTGEYDVTLGGSGSALAKSSSSPPPSQWVHLKPLHRLATPQEISGFFRIAIPRIMPDVSFDENTDKLPEKLTIEDVIRQYEELITEDTYIVGIDQQGKPCVSDFSKIPHRIVAGVPGSGKTNLITSVIYQYLYANFERKIYIADFQAGMHYQLIVDKQPNLKMVTQLEDCANLLDELWKEHELRRQLMRENKVRSLTDLKKKHGIQKHRIVLIIDEAFYIQNAERKTKDSIEKNLMGLAAQARVTGIHIIYCSQRPTPEVIPSQISDNMDERVIFRVQLAASQRLLDDDVAASLPVEPRGRAVYRGLEPNLKVVATPYVPDDIWEHPLF